MELATLRRLGVLFLAFGLLLPVAPEMLGFPVRRGSCLGIRVGGEQCAEAALACLALSALARAAAWPRLSTTERRRTWAAAAFVAFALVLLPTAPLPRWSWDLLR